MSFAFSQVEPNRSGQVAPDIGFGSFMGNAFKQGINDGAFPSISRMTEMWLENNDSALFGLIQWEGSQEMSADVANQRAKDAGLRLHFDEPVRASVYAIMADRKEREQQRQFFIENGMTSPGRFVAALGAQMIGSMLNPIDFGSMFLPMVGSTRLAAGAAMLGRSSARRTLQRGILTSHENLVKNNVPFPKFTAAVIDGTAGQALVEIPLLAANLQDQADYGFQDFAINVAAGGLFSGGFRISMDAAMNIFGKVQAHTRQQMFRRALDQFVKDEDIDVHRYVDIDEDMLKRQAIFDEAEARIRAKESVESVEAYVNQAIDDLRQKGTIPDTIYRGDDGNPVIAFHATDSKAARQISGRVGASAEGTVGRFSVWQHFGTLKAAIDRAYDKYGVVTEPSVRPELGAKPQEVTGKPYNKLTEAADQPITFYPVVFNVRALLKVDDTVAQRPTGWSLKKAKDQLVEAGADPDEVDAFAKKLDDMYYSAEGSYDEALEMYISFMESHGFDGFMYRNAQEDKGSTSFAIFRGEKVHKLGEQEFEYSESVVRKRARQLRENAVKKFIRDEKKAHDPEKKYNELKLQEIQRQIAEGKILKPEDIHRYRHLLVGKKGQEIIDEETKNLEDRIRAATGEVDISTLSPLQRLFLNKVARHYTKADPQKIKDEGFSDDVAYFALNDSYKGSFGDNKVELLITPRIAKNLEVDVYDLFMASPEEILPTTMHWEKYLVENPPEGMTSAQVRDLAEDPIGGAEELNLDDAYLLQAINKHPELLDQLPIKINRKLTSADIDGFTPQERAFINQSARPDTEGIQAGIDCLINNG